MTLGGDRAQRSRTTAGQQETDGKMVIREFATIMLVPFTEVWSSARAQARVIANRLPRWSGVVAWLGCAALTATCSAQDAMHRLTPESLQKTREIIESYESQRKQVPAEGLGRRFALICMSTRSSRMTAGGKSNRSSLQRNGRRPMCCCSPSIPPKRRIFSSMATKGLSMAFFAFPERK